MAISIYKFLSLYYGISLEVGVECSHKLLKREFPFLQSCSFEYADSNPDLVATGHIVYVFDTQYHAIPYVLPVEIKTTYVECRYLGNSEKISDVIDWLDEISNLSTYDLKKLLSKYKDRPSVYRIIKSELISRGIYQNKIYKKEKENEKIYDRESEYNDKYKRRRKVKRNKS